MATHGDHITVYSDYVCPFCYLGRRSVDAYQQTRNEDLSIEWHPFDLRSGKRQPDGKIDHSVDDGKDEAYFDQVRQNVTRLKEAYDVNEMLSLDQLPDQIDSFNAQLASFYVQSEYPELWLDFDEAIFDALWIEGRDIDDPSVMGELAEAVGVDAHDMRTAIASEELHERLRERFTDAQQKGITGVPTYIYDGYVARGAIPPDHLARLVEGT